MVYDATDLSLYCINSAFAQQTQQYLLLMYSVSEYIPVKKVDAKKCGLTGHYNGNYELDDTHHPKTAYSLQGYAVERRIVRPAHAYQRPSPGLTLRTHAP